MKDLDSLIFDCFRICNALEIPFSDNISIVWNGRITRKWGYCRKIRDTYQISIATRLSEDAVPDEPGPTGVGNRDIYRLCSHLDGDGHGRERRAPYHRHQ